MTNAQDIDRISSTRRPEESRIGTQRWRKLLFMHWPVSIDALRALVPKDLELDLWQGQAWIGVVPFAMEGVKPWWSPEALAFDFLETNVRTYVHYKGEPGVFFLSLEAASHIAVKVARWRWGLPYFRADMSLKEDQGVIEYKSQRLDQADAMLNLRWRPGERLGPSEPGSLEHFFLERYLLFVHHQNQILRGQVHHTPYPTQRAELLSIETGLVEATGLSVPPGPPTLVHYAEGVDVDIFALRPV